MKAKWMVLVSVIAIAVMVIGVLGTGAWFTDTKTSGTSTISSGTLLLNGEGISGFTLGTIENMAPGDKTPEAVVIVKNDGTIPLVWFGDLVVSGDGWMKEAVYIDYAKMEFVAKPGGTWGEPTDNFITNGRGSGPSPSWYNTLADLSPFHVNTLKVFDGTTGMGTAPYEFMGALKTGYSYKLTLRFGFAELAGNEYQGKGPLNLSFKVVATQVKEGAVQAVNPAWAAPSLITWANTQLGNQVP